MSKHMYLKSKTFSIFVSVFRVVYSAIWSEARRWACVCCNSLVVLQQDEARGKKESEQAIVDWLASRVDRLNTVVQVIITVLLNTSITAEYICLALLSGSVLFKSFIHLGSFLFLPYVCIAHIYINHICFSFIISFSREWHICTGATIVVGRCRQQVSFEFTLLLLVVMMVVVYVIYTAPSLSCCDEELRNIIFLSFFLLHSTFF